MNVACGSYGEITITVESSGIWEHNTRSGTFQIAGYRKEVLNRRAQVDLFVTFVLRRRLDKQSSCTLSITLTHLYTLSTTEQSMTLDFRVRDYVYECV